MKRCKSWRIIGWKIARCSWDARHVRKTSWHCNETLDKLWPVRSGERYKFPKEL